MAGVQPNPSPRVRQSAAAPEEEAPFDCAQDRLGTNGEAPFDRLRTNEKGSARAAEWEEALGAFRGAEAALVAVELKTTGASFYEEEGLEAEHDARLSDHCEALRHLLRTPAPDLAALARKIELMIDHEVATLSGGEACLAAIRADARRLAG